MKSKILWWILGALGIFFLLSSLAITFVEYNRYKTQTAGVFPAGSTVASVPVGGLNASEAEARLSDYYSLPLDLEIEGSTVAAAPADLGFTFDPTALVRTSLDQVGKGGFWAALWNKTEATPITVPLDATVDQNTLRAYLNKEIAPRYTQPGNPLTPIANTTNFDLSTSGSRLDIDLAVTDITTALLSPDVHQGQSAGHGGNRNGIKLVHPGSFSETQHQLDRLRWDRRSLPAIDGGRSKPAFRRLGWRNRPA